MDFVWSVLSKIAPLAPELDGARGSEKMSRASSGVPEIRADSLGEFAALLGRAHATDRLTQCVFLRLAARSELSTRVSREDELVAIDSFFASLGAADDADEEARTWELEADRAAADARDGDRRRRRREALEFVRSYCDGFNAVALRSRRPAELIALRVSVDPWTPADVLLVAKVMSYIGLAQAQEDAQRVAIEAVRGGCDPGMVEALFSPPSVDVVRFKDWAALARKVRHVQSCLPEEVRFLSAVPRVAASNNWTVGGQHTASGYPLHCCDPHLEVNRLPAIWYEFSATYGPGECCAGVSMPGIPGLVMGRTSHLAASFTYGFMDQVDFFFEETRAGLVRTGPGEDDFEPPVARETKLRAGTVTHWRFEHPRHRNRVLEVPDDIARSSSSSSSSSASPPTLPDGFWLSRAWVGRDGDAAVDTVAAVLEMLKATDVEQGRLAVRGVAISCNWLLSEARAAGSIALQQSGRSPIRRRPAGASAAGRASARAYAASALPGDGFFPVPGWDPAYAWDPDGPRAPELLVSEVNPPCGYLFTANEDVGVGRAGANNSPVGLAMAPHRAHRIGELLHEAAARAARGERGADVAAMMAIQGDLVSRHAGAMMAGPLGDAVRSAARAAPSEAVAQVAQKLLEWDLSYDLESDGAPLFESVYAAALEAIFAPLFGDGAWSSIRSETGVLVDFYGVFDEVLFGAPRSATYDWFRGSTAAEVILCAVEDTLEEIAVLRGGSLGRWRDSRKVAMNHIVFGGKLPAFLGFDERDVPLPGSRGTIVQGAIYRHHGRVTTFCPSYRCITDLAEPVLHTALAGGVSGSPFSKLYKSDLVLWRTFGYKELSVLADPAKSSSA